MPERRFPSPWTVEEYRRISYIVSDANRFAVAYVYFEPQTGRRAAANLMTKRCRGAWTLKTSMNFAGRRSTLVRFALERQYEQSLGDGELWTFLTVLRTARLIYVNQLNRFPRPPDKA